MPGLDTNLLVRWLVQDDDAQTARARRALETKELTLQSEAAVEQALHWFRQGPAEFADCLHAGLCSHAGAPPMQTFDKGAARLPNTRLI